MWHDYVIWSRHREWRDQKGLPDANYFLGWLILKYLLKKGLNIKIGQGASAS
jgi:hypothetical protein